MAQIVRLIHRSNLRQALIAATLLCLWSSAFGGQEADSEDTWLGLADIRMADNGDLVGWRVSGLGAGTSELIGPGESLLVLQLFVADEDVSDQVTWRRLPPSPGFSGRFVGAYADRGLEIRRDYLSGLNHSTIFHEVQITAPIDADGSDVRLQLLIPPNLRKHAPHDGSFGDAFYGYNRVFAAAPSEGLFEPVREERQAAALALVARHVAVVVTPDLASNDALTVRPDSGAVLTMQSANIPRPIGRCLELWNSGVMY